MDERQLAADSHRQPLCDAHLDAAPEVDLGNGTSEELELETPAGPPSFGVVIANTEPGPTSVALVRDEYVIAPELQRDGERHESLIEAARPHLGPRTRAWLDALAVEVRHSARHKTQHDNFTALAVWAG